MNQLYGRKPAAPWTYDEQYALAAVAKRPDALDELVHICHWRGKMPLEERRRFFPQSVSSLLNHWTETLDKAHVQCPVKKTVVAAPKPLVPPMPLEKRRQLFDLARKETHL